MSPTIRPALPEDAAIITGLSGQLGYPATADGTAQNLEALRHSPSDLVLVAILEERVVGWMHVFDAVRLESGRFCEIGGLVVDASFRSQGIGKALTEAAKRWCRERGCPVLKVRSQMKREAAHRFYRNAGFTEVKEQKVFEYRL